MKKILHQLWRKLEAIILNTSYPNVRMIVTRIFNGIKASFSLVMPPKNNNRHK